MAKLLLAVLAAWVPASVADRAPIVALSAPAERDLQCLALALLAAGTQKDETRQQAVIAESWYFLGRLDIEAPHIDLKQATNHALATMKGDPHAKDIGSACDAQFSKRGGDLAKMGDQPQK